LALHQRERRLVDLRQWQRYGPRGAAQTNARRDNGSMDPARAAQIGRTIAAMIKAVAQARTLADRGAIGADFRELVQHARQLHELALEELAADPEAGEYARGLAETISNKLDELEAMLAEQAPHRPLH
jgi:hypothetical protein